MDLNSTASKNITQRLSFQTAGKDQVGIARDLAAGKDVPEVYYLSDAGFFDEFFYSLNEVGGACPGCWISTRTFPNVLRRSAFRRSSSSI
jgi:hypothetical protein